MRGVQPFLSCALIRAGQFRSNASTLSRLSFRIAIHKLRGVPWSATGSGETVDEVLEAFELDVNSELMELRLWVSLEAGMDG